jgi:hypothetical protein
MFRCLRLLHVTTRQSVCSEGRWLSHRMYVLAGISVLPTDMGVMQVNGGEALCA